MARYTFGDDELAVERLRLVAAAYEPVSRAFLEAEAPRRPPVALDLGCGPGFSTELLIGACAPTQVIGVDASGDFVRLARARLSGITFETHDATVMPLPGAPADVIYSRLLLAHVPHPRTVAQRWLGQLSAGGVLLVEDLEEVVAPPGPLRHYEEVSAESVRRGGGVMYAGAELAGLGGSCRTITVAGALAARIYLFNVRQWLGDRSGPRSSDELRAVERELKGVVAADHGATVSWVVRQLAVRG